MISKISSFQPRGALAAPPVPMESAEWIVACLEKAGVEYVFGVPGGAVEPLFNAMARSARRGGLRPVIARHESGAAFMADGYARETGKLGVCLATSGPGATNMITGIACAYGGGVPLLALTGQPALASFGKGALQESSCTGVDIVGMFGHCTRYNSLVSHIDQVETKVVAAILHALRKPSGPAHLSIPVDVLRGLLVPRNAGSDLPALLRDRPSLLDERTVAALDAELASAARIVFLIGDGAAEAVDAIMTLVNLTGALFITAPDAKGLINPFHEAYRGVFGFGGHASAEGALKADPDLVVAFGTGFGELASNGWCKSLLNNRLIHVDESEENLIRSPMAKLHVRGRIRAVCDRIIAARQPSIGEPTHGTPYGAGLPHGYGVALQASEKYHSDAAPIKPQRLMKELSKRFPPTARFLADTGNSMIWAAHYLQPWGRRGLGHRMKSIGYVEGERRSGTSSWLRIALEFAPMGWAIGAAIGAARANPRRPVVCITGDGSYLMSGQELTTAAEEGLPVIFVILNDHAYGMVMHGQRLAGAEPIAFDLPKIDFRAMAGAMGVPGHVIESPADFDRIDFPAMLSRPGPTLLDVRVDREEVPPMILRLKTLGSVKA
ncbi:MAG TPA: thiamine pyrophosphate-binding protein [Fibrobacteria bacterium]|nr:thiamine pyrophosphate-binding protein [Fibrobacteria bacterium]